MIYEFIILGILLLIAILQERISLQINPYLWIIGGIIALVFGIMGIGVVSLLESVICFGVAFGLMLLVYPLRAIGGGVLKILMMCAFFFGRYVLITYVLFCLLGLIWNKLRKCRKEEQIPGESLVYAMPLVAVAAVLTVFCIILL